MEHETALLLLLREGSSGEVYNIGANQDPERTNEELTRIILAATGKPDALIRPVEGLRPGHDQRYAVDTRKIRRLGWTPLVDIEDGVAQTVEWYRARRDWWEPLKSGEYLEFYREHYQLEG